MFIILLNKIGKIRAGEMNNWYIIIKDDHRNTGGYLVFQSPNYDFKNQVFDDWFLNIEELNQYIKDLNVDWNYKN